MAFIKNLKRRCLEGVLAITLTTGFGGMGINSANDHISYGDARPSISYKVDKEESGGLYKKFIRLSPRYNPNPYYLKKSNKPAEEVQKGCEAPRIAVADNYDKTTDLTKKENPKPAIDNSKARVARLNAAEKEAIIKKEQKKANQLEYILAQRPESIKAEAVKLPIYEVKHEQRPASVVATPVPAEELERAEKYVPEDAKNTDRYSKSIEPEKFEQLHARQVEEQTRTARLAAEKEIKIKEEKAEFWKKKREALLPMRVDAYWFERICEIDAAKKAAERPEAIKAESVKLSEYKIEQEQKPESIKAEAVKLPIYEVKHEQRPASVVATPVPAEELERAEKLREAPKRAEKIPEEKAQKYASPDTRSSYVNQVKQLSAEEKARIIESEFIKANEFEKSLKDNNAAEKERMPELRIGPRNLEGLIDIRLQEKFTLLPSTAPTPTHEIHAAHIRQILDYSLCIESKEDKKDTVNETDKDIKLLEISLENDAFKTMKEDVYHITVDSDGKVKSNCVDRVFIERRVNRDEIVYKKVNPDERVNPNDVIERRVNRDEIIDIRAGPNERVYKKVNPDEIIDIRAGPNERVYKKVNPDEIIDIRPNFDAPAKQRPRQTTQKDKQKSEYNLVVGGEGYLRDKKVLDIPITANILPKKDVSEKENLPFINDKVYELLDYLLNRFNIESDKATDKIKGTLSIMTRDLGFEEAKRIIDNALAGRDVSNLTAEEIVMAINVERCLHEKIIINS